MDKNNLEDMVRQRKDIREIRNLMSRYVYFLWAAMYEEIVELFAINNSDVKAEICDWGVYTGREGIKRLYIGLHKYLDGDRLGIMNLHTLASPLIEVAEDGNTAKGVWVSQGIESRNLNRHQAYWLWLRYGVDFVKEEDGWRIWHLHKYGVFRVPYEESWVDYTPQPIEIPAEFKADKQSTYHWIYRRDIGTENVPAPPEPYKTWDDSMSYIS